MEGFKQKEYLTQQQQNDLSIFIEHAKHSLLVPTGNLDTEFNKIDGIAYLARTGKISYDDCIIGINKLIADRDEP